MKNIDEKNIDLDKLILDVDNPRFAELYNGSKVQDDLIDYLLYNESGEEIVTGIKEVGGFYPDRPLWVLRKENDFLVKDGNRRCAAVKALQSPSKYGLNELKYSISKLPVLVYENEKELEKRILQEHTANLFKEWDRIAKALEAYKLYFSGDSLDSMKDIDSSPSALIKLASFYYEAVKIGEEDFKKLLRRGRGKTGGKTIIFERLFKFGEKCGYRFKRKPSYEIDVTDKASFKKYILAIIEYLKNNPKTTHKAIDDKGIVFLDDLKQYGFSQNKKPDSCNKKNEEVEKDEKLTNPGEKRLSIKLRPKIKRKKLPRPLLELINECYNLNKEKFPNAKIALTRVSLECSLKFVVDKTQYKNKELREYDIFRSAFFDGKGNHLAYTNFDCLKIKFTELITDTGIKKAFVEFNLDNPHQIIHNYNVGAIPSNAQVLCDNLIPLLDFLLQDEDDLLSSLDLLKIK
jgi:hypothetical protein